MPASERDAKSRDVRPEARPHPAPETAGLSMSDLLASCAAATAVSTPPREPDPVEPPHPKAARPKAA